MNKRKITIPKNFFKESNVAVFCSILLLVSLALSLSEKVPYVFTAIMFVLFLYAGVIWSYFRQTLEDKKNTLIIFLVTLLILSFFVRTTAISANDISRLATMSSLLHENTFETGPDIGIDKIKANEKYYSSKPPVLSFLGAGVYALTREAASWKGKSIKNPREIYYWIAFFLITIPSALAAVLFYKLLSFTKIKTHYRYILAFSLVFGTLIFMYSGTINNHTITAVALLAAFYCLCRARFYNSTKSAMASGFLFAMAGVFELSSLIWLVIFGGYLLLIRRYKFCGWYILGALLPLIFHLSFQYQITGEVIPPQLAGKLNYTDSPWMSEGLRKSHAQEPWNIVLWKITIGERGIFMYTPLFVLSFIGLFINLINRKRKFWLEAACTLIGILTLFAFYVFYIKGGGYGGSAYGFRWLIQIIPLLFFFTAFLFEDENPAWFKHSMFVIFLIALFFSIYLDYTAIALPWRTTPPPFYFNVTFYPS